MEPTQDMIRSTPLDQLTVTVVVDNETDNLSSIDAGMPQLPEVASLLGRISPTRAALTATTASPCSITCAWRVTASRCC